MMMDRSLSGLWGFFSCTSSKPEVSEISGTLRRSLYFLTFRMENQIVGVQGAERVELCLHHVVLALAPICCDSIYRRISNPAHSWTCSLSSVRVLECACPPQAPLSSPLVYLTCIHPSRLSTPSS